MTPTFFCISDTSNALHHENFSYINFFNCLFNFLVKLHCVGSSFSKILLLRNYGHFRGTKLTILTLDKADTMNFSYINFFNCVKLHCVVCHLVKYFKDSWNVQNYFIDIVELFYLTRLFFAHPAITNSHYYGTKRRAECVCSNES